MSNDQEGSHLDLQLGIRLSQAAEQLVEKIREVVTDITGEEFSVLPTSNSPELTALHEAIAKKNLRKVNTLIRNSVDINQCHTNPDWGFPLIHAFETEDKRIIRALLKAGANPNVRDFLAVCIKENRLSLAKMLIEYGADLKGQPTWEKNEEFETNLIRATRLGQFTFVKILLEAGADPDVHNGDNESALFVARMNKNNRLIKLLEQYVSAEEKTWVNERFSEANAKRLKLDKEIYDAIHAGKHTQFIRLLKDSGRSLGDLLEPKRGSLLEEALDAYFIALNATFPQIDTADLAERCANYKPNYNHPEVIAKRKTVYALLDLNAPVDKIGWKAPLAYLEYLSDKEDDIEFGMKLIEKATDVNAPVTSENYTALMVVVSTGLFGYSTIFAKELLERGADPNARNCYGQSILQRARESEPWAGPNPCVPLLLEAGAKE